MKRSDKILMERVKKNFRLNMNDPRNFTKYTSIEMMQVEQEFQREYYKMRIHPHSRFRVFWDTFFCGFSIIHLVSSNLFFTISRYTPLNLNNLLTLSVPDLFIVINIYFNFITGFYENEREGAVMSLGEIRKHYMRLYFILDSIGLIMGSPLLLLVTKYDNYDKYHYIEVYWMFFIRCVGLFFRVISPWEYWKNRLSKYYLCDGLVSSIIQYFLFFPVILFLLNEIAFTTNYEMEAYFSIGQTSFEVVNSFFSTAISIWESGEVIKDRSRPALIILDVALVLFPYIRYFITTTFLILFFWSRRGSSDRYNEQFDNLNQYLQQVRLSERLKLRIMKFYEEIREDKYFSEMDILNNASSEVKEDIVSLKISRMKKEIIVLDFIPMNELLLICRHLVYELYLGNDVVAYSGEPHDRLYFIARGTIAVYNDNAKELLHLSPTQHSVLAGVHPNFPAIAFNYLACETSVLYSLSRTDYAFIIDSCPVFKELLTFVGDIVTETGLFLKEKLDEPE